MIRKFLISSLPSKNVGNIQKPKEQFEWLSKIGIPAITLIILALQTFNVFPEYKYYFFYIALGVILLIVGLSIWAKPFNFISNYLIQRSKNKIIKKYLQEFTHFINLFEEIFNPQYDSLARRISSVHTQDKGTITLEQISPNSIWELFKIFKERYFFTKKSYKELKLLINEFDFCLGLYNEYCIKKPWEELNNKLNDTKDSILLHPSTKSYFNKLREAYIKLLQDYINFSKKVNNELGERVFKENFEIIGAI